jgi:hypothetical protein
MTTTARVDVLTAEVRVLMVGSRQVTMSVFEQLDPVEPGQIEPFGRVSRRRAHCPDPYYGSARTSPDCPGDCIDVVGRHWSSGVLIRSCVPAYGASHVKYRREWAELELIVLAGLR